MTDVIGLKQGKELENDMKPSDRKHCGRLGHEFVTSDESMMSARHMCQLFKDHMNTAFDKWTTRERFEVLKA